MCYSHDDDNDTGDNDDDIEFLVRGGQSRQKTTVSFLWHTFFAPSHLAFSTKNDESQSNDTNDGNMSDCPS
jgi:hypothetical protein